MSAPVAEPEPSVASARTTEPTRVGPGVQPGRSAVVAAGAALTAAEAAAVLRDLDAALAGSPERLVVDLGDVDHFDTGGLAVIVEALRRGAAVGVSVRLRGVSQGMLDLLSLVSLDRLAAGHPAREARGRFERIGIAVLPQLEAVGRVAAAASAVARALFADPWRGRLPRFDRTVKELDHAAVGALPIALLIAFLLGLILALQAWAQLKVWSAEIYLANMVGVSVVTEIGPLMTAIVLAARTGSSDAAILGAMVVGEEVDALRQMGIDPTRYLVVPKVLAAAIAAVAVGLLFSATALAGGALFGWAVAGIGPALFRGQLEQALGAGDLLFACGKSLAFGTAVGLVACAEGLGVRGGSEGVGRATTRAVVLAVFLIIVLDALFVVAQRLVLA